MSLIAKIKAKLTVAEIVRLLKQPSTKRAIIVVAGMAGYQIAPEYVEQIIQGTLGVFALYEGLRDGDKKAL